MSFCTPPKYPFGRWVASGLISHMEWFAQLKSHMTKKPQKPLIILKYLLTNQPACFCVCDEGSATVMQLIVIVEHSSGQRMNSSCQDHLFRDAAVWLSTVTWLKMQKFVRMELTSFSGLIDCHMDQSVTNLIRNKNNKRCCPKHRCQDDIWNIQVAHYNPDI